MAAPQEQTKGGLVTSTNKDGASPSQLLNTYPQQLTTLNQPFSLKLDKNNFTLWKTMVSTIVRDHRLHGYLNGIKMCPPEFIPVTGEAKYEGELETNPKGNSTGRGRGSHNSNQYTGNGGRFSGNKGSSGRFRGRGRTNTLRPTCQVCGKYGHSTTVCYNRFDESYMGADPNNTNGGNKTPQTNHNAFIANPEVLESDAWFADSGASNHITSDVAALSQKQPYGGKEKVIVGDGSKLSISHVGSGNLDTNDGYNTSHKGYNCLTPTGCIYISRNVVFNELEFPFKHGFLNNYKTPKPVIIHSSSCSTLPIPTFKDHRTSRYVHPQPEAFSEASPDLEPVSEIDAAISDAEPAAAASPQLTLATALQPTYQMMTRAKEGIFKPKTYLSSAKATATYAEPESVEEALKHPWWNNAMNTEVVALKKNRTWVLVPPSNSQNLVGNKWIFSIKLRADGTVERLKARLVAKGFHQRPRIDYGETFSPVIKASTVRIVVTIAASRGWEIRQLDINNAFLNGILKEEVFMAQPQGLEEKGKENWVCKLNKSIYGLKQAPRAWFDKLKGTLITWKFENSRADTSVFFYKTEKSVILVLIYVDDIIVTGNDATKFFLGIEVFRDETGLYLTQTRYIKDILKKVNLINLKPCPTPVTAGKPLSIKDGEPMHNSSVYRSIIGSLQYLCHTRPDIAYSVNTLSQFLQGPTTVHWNALKRVLRYLKGSKHLRLHISCNNKLNIIGFCDADWACCPDDRRSVAGY
uniref:Reverse transcriptase Ty1/copia-type domain-containing protein n=1 Tax=Cannabis sativa TaxID=3483 RepID=A0A803PZP0_CANSA